MTFSRSQPKSKNGCAASTPLSHTPPSKTRKGAEMLILHLHVPVAWCVINAVFEDCFRRRLSLTNREDDLGCDFLAEYETCLCTVNRSERFCSSAPNTALGFTATPGAMIASNCHARHDDYHPSMWSLRLPRDISTAYLSTHHPFAGCGLWNCGSRLQHMEFSVKNPHWLFLKRAGATVSRLCGKLNIS